jgi:autotransporter-associated beta strand protein
MIKHKTKNLSHRIMKNKIHVLLAASLLLMTIHSSQASSATWNLDPISDQWNNPTNWTPATVPNGHHDTATFDVSNTTGILISHHTGLEAIVFNPGASSYTIATSRDLNLDGAGVVNNSGVEQDFVILSIVGKIHFRNNASAGEDVHYSVRAGAGETTELSFYDTATAGGAIINNHGGGLPGATLFFDSSTAGNATITNNAGSPNGAGTVFMGDSNAGTATFISQGKGTGNTGVQFRERSSAANGTFIVEGGPAHEAGQITTFTDYTTAGSATLIANGGNERGAPGGTIIFYPGFVAGTPTAENARIIANSGSNGGQGGRIYFNGDARGGNARVELAHDGVLSVEYTGASGISLGSIEGNGRLLLGSTNLAVGKNNLDTTFSGRIEDGAFAGGSLRKVGIGSLALSGANTYTGGTIVSGGTLSVGNTNGAATGAGNVSVEMGRLSGDGIIAGVVTVGTNTGITATISPGRDPLTAGTLTVQSNVILNEDATYQFNLQSDAETAAMLSTNGISIGSNAFFIFHDSGNSALLPGSSFIVIDNTGATAISGTFSNLVDGGTVTIGSNTYQANYEGGDGNDLTLTVVP